MSAVTYARWHPVGRPHAAHDVRVVPRAQIDGAQAALCHSLRVAHGRGGPVGAARRRRGPPRRRRSGGCLRATTAARCPVQPAPARDPRGAAATTRSPSDHTSRPSPGCHSHPLWSTVRSTRSLPSARIVYSVELTPGRPDASVSASNGSCSRTSVAPRGLLADAERREGLACSAGRASPCRRWGTAWLRQARHARRRHRTRSSAARMRRLLPLRDRPRRPGPAKTIRSGR